VADAEFNLDVQTPSAAIGEIAKGTRVSQFLVLSPVRGRGDTPVTSGSWTFRPTIPHGT
jgi:hypothetical protein